MKHPDTEQAPLTQNSLAPHPDPSARAVQSLVFTPGWQLWQPLAGLSWPEL